MLNTCPKCHHTDLHLHALIRAVLHSCRESNGSVQYSLLDWDEIIKVESYECLNCGLIFTGENKI